MCGGALDVPPGASIVQCGYCDSAQTLPRLDDERRANMYDRASHYRRANDFDKALAIYEQVLNADPSDAEAYWSLVLCRYGIEYVEDPQTHKRVPTINRMQYGSILADPDYTSAIGHADDAQRELYKAEAAAIDALQKGILEISGKEEPFDVFICYKETDERGRRTPDSVLATDLYHQLTQEGFKVFFSRITLEDKLGSAYEPYIFAALNSARVMIALGTRPEYFNAPWVKNEWSRFLALIRSGKNKALIPAYRDMDPYDLPEAFSHLQAQDMSKLGFMQDLIRGIKKILGASAAPAAKAAAAQPQVAAFQPAAPLLERAFMFLEDGEWKKADEFCERVLNLEPRNARAYLGKLLAELKVTNLDELKNCGDSFENSNNYKKCRRFADDSLARRLESYLQAISNKKEIEQRQTMERLARLERERKKAERNKVIKGILIAVLLVCALRACSSYDSQEKVSREEISQAKTAQEKVSQAEPAEKRVAQSNEAVPQEKIVQEKMTQGKASQEKIAQKKVSQEKPAEKKGVQSEKRKAGFRKGDFSGAAIGDVIPFGRYEQDNNADNGKEPVEWVVLARNDKRILVISRYGLDSKPYHTKHTSVTWETCSLRQWLNTRFYRAAFSSAEQKRIFRAKVTADKNPGYRTPSGNDTADKVFLLSIQEAEKLFGSNSARQCRATAYARAQGAYTAGFPWWLRSPGDSGYNAAGVDTLGGVRSFGFSVNNVSFAVRPALWINL